MVKFYNIFHANRWYYLHKMLAPTQKLIDLININLSELKNYFYISVDLDFM